MHMNPPSSTGNTMAMNNNYVTFLGLDPYQKNGSYNSLVLNGGNPVKLKIVSFILPLVVLVLVDQ